MIASPRNAPGNGHTICYYTAIVAFAGKEPFCAYQPSMAVPRQTTEADTEALAAQEAESQIEDFWARTMPDGAPRPKVTGVRLGSLTFVPGDYEWSPA